MREQGHTGILWWTAYVLAHHPGVRLHAFLELIMARSTPTQQATINIGTIGHVAHGKSTVVKAISGVNTVRCASLLHCCFFGIGEVGSSRARPINQYVRPATHNT